MTYNFDPERWYDNEIMVLEARRRQNTLSAEAFDQAMDRLDQRFEAMLARLDGTYRLPETSA